MEKELNMRLMRCVSLLCIVLYFIGAYAGTLELSWKPFDPFKGLDTSHLGLNVHGSDGVVPSSNTASTSTNAALTHKLPLKVPVFVSIAVIKSRLHRMWACVDSILAGDEVPDAVYVFVSKEAYLLDEGTHFATFTSIFDMLYLPNLSKSSMLKTDSNALSFIT